VLVEVLALLELVEDQEVVEDRHLKKKIRCKKVSFQYFQMEQMVQEVQMVG
jgi:hypothetical protein